MTKKLVRPFFFSLEEEKSYKDQTRYQTKYGKEVFFFCYNWCISVRKKLLEAVDSMNET